MSSYSTAKAARAYAEVAQAQLPNPKTWKIRVWQNGGWNFSLQRGPISVHTHGQLNESPRGYWALIAPNLDESGSGRQVWTTHDAGIRKTPWAAAQLAMQAVRDYGQKELDLLLSMTEFFNTVEADAKTKETQNKTRRRSKSSRCC